jgi:cytochrome c
MQFAMMALLIVLVASNASSAATPPPAFAICGACHATQVGAPARMGPNLHGVVDRKAGTAPGFAYSPAMTGSDLTWSVKALDAFIANPQKVVPGAKMPYGGENDPARRAAIIQFLSTLR